MKSNMEYKFKVFIDGNWYYDDEEFERNIELSDTEVATIKELICKHYYELFFDDIDVLTPDLMMVLQEGPDDLYQKFYDTIYPHVFFELFLRDEEFEPNPGDEDREWDEDEDVDYLMETYGDGYDFDSAYIVYIPDEMMPPKSPLSKRMSDREILRYIRETSRLREEIYNHIADEHDIYISEQDTLYEVIEEKLTAMIKKAIKNNAESTLSQVNFDPFANIDLKELTNIIYKEFQEKN